MVTKLWVNRGVRHHTESVFRCVCYLFGLVLFFLEILQLFFEFIFITFELCNRVFFNEFLGIKRRVLIEIIVVLKVVLYVFLVDFIAGIVSGLFKRVFCGTSVKNGLLTVGFGTVLFGGKVGLVFL